MTKKTKSRIIKAFAIVFIIMMIVSLLGSNALLFFS